MFQKFTVAAIAKSTRLSERQIRVVASDPTVDRVKDVMVPQGCVLDAYRQNNIVLADHDPTKPIGNADVTATSERVEAVITFAPKGVSLLADERCALYKASVLKAVSVGFQPIEYEPNEAGGTLYTKWLLLEISCVSMPANHSAVAIERSYAPPASVPGRRRERGQLAFRLAAYPGLRSPSPEAWRAYVRQKFPQGSLNDAIASYLALKRAMTPDQICSERMALSEFARRHEKIEAMRTQVREEIAGADSGTPRYRDAAAWCADIRAADEARINRALRSWRT